MNFYDIFMSPLEKGILTEIRKNIIFQAYGNVLEIGYGTGVNFQYYNPALIKNLIGLDQKTSFELKTAAPFPVQLIKGQAENLPYPDESFDTVVETLVLYSVKKLDIVINEVLRVLKPGGIFIFIDHVLPENQNLSSLFKAANTFWPKIASGCNLTREPHKLINSSGFTIEQSGTSGYDIFRWGIGRKNC
ncbi:class I SAM-dependent methyltransferase [Desulfitobacterium sp. Sab5]|uniref:class I SAM-dependent methyltransferase n=1 Tax=Desulfitobacterium nosdiversum TaxID=3375356 RepID=UPI003CE771D5